MAKNDKDLKKAASETNRALRALRITAVLTRYLKKVGIHPILVGGAAVEFYTVGDYATQDIDLIAPHNEVLLNIMSDLGFKRKGRYFIHRPYKILIEFPSSTLQIGEKTTAIDVEGEIVSVISLEDLIIDRLEAAKWGGSKADFQNAILLLNQDPNKDEVRQKAKSADVLDTLKKAIQNGGKRKK